MMRLTIGAIEHGWADVEIVLKGQSWVYIFEHPQNDALERLLYSARTLSGTLGKPVTILFWYGASSKSLTIENIDNNLCKIIINDEYACEVTLKQYARAVLRMFDKYLYKHSEEEYAREWRRSFPRNELDSLRSQYRKL